MSNFKKPLTPKREKYAQARANGKNQTDAYREAFTTTGMTPSTLWNVAYRIENVPQVRARIDELRAAVEAVSTWDRAALREIVLRDAMDVLDADPSDLITHRRLNCRYCHGIDHEYRWRDEREFWTALAETSKVIEGWGQRPGKPPELPTCAGGYGWRKLHPPSIDCPHCEGEGIPETRVADIRTLNTAARRLYAGVKVKKDGSIEVKTRDKEAARAVLAREAGMMDSNVKLSGVLGLAPVPVAQLSPEAAAAIGMRLEDEI